MNDFEKQINEMSNKVIELTELRDKSNKSAEDYEIAIREEREEFEKQREEHRKRVRELEVEARKRRLVADQARKDLELVNKALSNVKVQQRTETARVEAEKNLQEAKKLNAQAKEKGREKQTITKEDVAEVNANTLGSENGN